MTVSSGMTVSAAAAWKGRDRGSSKIHPLRRAESNIVPYEIYNKVYQEKWKKNNEKKFCE
jgi:hypothetical protein